jgi:hypothetical protein
VYLGLTPEITVLEVLVHFNGVLIAPLVLSAYEVPAGPGLISEAEPEALPGQASAVFGGDWLRDGGQLGLLLNPLHPAMQKVALVHQEPFQLDERLG